MERMEGLKEYVMLPSYRKALELPEEQEETYHLLAQGEYNINYYFEHPLTKKRLLLRVNCGSQMHLEHQIEYEYDALKMLEPSKRTPRAVYVDGSLEHLGHGVMVMEYLPGEALDYREDLERAAACLADIHSVSLSKVQKEQLLSPKQPLKAILEECEEMVKIYMDSPMGDNGKKVFIRHLLDLGWRRVRSKKEADGYHCCINTELNSTNFLVDRTGGHTYLIDWEKPLYGDPAQDLGHFLAPTTTFWKTDIILGKEAIDDFLDRYLVAVGGRFPTDGIRERVYTFIPVTCLRGITWCAMAWVQYKQPGKLIFNESTFRKLEAYLDWEFLRMIEGYLSEGKELCR